MFSELCGKFDKAKAVAVRFIVRMSRLVVAHGLLI